MSKCRSRIFRLLQCLLLSAYVAACGGGDIGGGSDFAGGASGTSGANVAAPGVGSGGTGSPIGSGGTGVSVGPITGFGSIVVNDVHHDIDGITPSIEDATELKLGMVVRVTGNTVSSGGITRGTATSVSTAAELRGAVAGIDVAAGTIDVQGMSVRTDSATVNDGFTSLGTLAVGQFVQISGLPLVNGGLHATRIEKISTPAELIIMGTIANLNASSTIFNIGSSTVNFGSAILTGMTSSELANGLTVRVRGQLSGSVFVATKIQRWQAPVEKGTTLSFAGVVSGYTSLSSTFTISDIAVNASAASITGGNPKRLGNDVKVDVEGTFFDGVLQATTLKIRHIPGDDSLSGGNPPVDNLPLFSATGRIAPFFSPSNFKVKGQAIDATQAGVVFVNGTAANLANGVQVSVVGRQVLNGVLIATQVSFEDARAAPKNQKS